ncbi:MAG: BON domain-containing protein [Nitrospira sp.]|nr:BON domain-containing protein [Nitrospira sp.]
MGTNITVLGIALIGLGVPLFAQVQGETRGSEMKRDLVAYDYPYPDDNWSYGADTACQDVSPRGPLGGTRDWEWKSDAELQRAVECQLTKSPFLKASGIQVAVRDGTATLSGTVHNQDSVRSAIVDAYQAGVKDVASELQVVEVEKK